MRASTRLSKKTAASKLGPKLKEAEAELAKCNALELAKALRVGPVEIAGVALDAADIGIDYASADPAYAGTIDSRGREAVVSTTITEELKLEGMARDVIRLVNQARKDAGLEIADSIELHLHSPAEMLAKALVVQRGSIAAETQTSSWSDTPLSPVGHASDAKIDGLALRIEFRKV